MMRILCLLIALGMASPVWAISSAWTQPSVYGDARYGALCLRTNLAGANSILMNVILPGGGHRGFTVVTWLRVKSVSNSFLAPYAWWCPDEITHEAPDLLNGSGAYGVPGGTNLTDLGGSITVASFPWGAYSAAHLSPVSNTWPKGVCTIAGWSSNEITVSLGGVDQNFGPGTFNKNMIPGPADSVVITGAGLASVGISKTPCFRYFDASPVDNISYVSWCVTQEIALVTWRFSADGTNQLIRINLGNSVTWSAMAFQRTQALPLTGLFDSRGDYRIGLHGPSASPPYDLDIFDARVFPWSLSDEEVERIHFNGIEEIQRRGIPQWR